ncbi:MAG: glycosyltransferase [Streptococcaceae bacterium]|jgi:glycosyltransferase involved in cell wall biosynthesis|nr:glycosyltransferase [Streptococcaceae bacterium]
MQKSEIIDLIKDSRIKSALEEQTGLIFEPQRLNFKLALVMLVKNQEENIENVLMKLRQTDIDEFIVVDTGSTDQTVDILKSLDFISLYELEWKEDFGYMRNKAAEFTDADWILTVDSDEILMTNVRLKSLIVALEDSVKVPFSVAFEQHYEGQSAYGYPERLYSPKVSRYFGKVHEEVRDFENNPVQVIESRVSITNLGISKSENEKFDKSRRYTSLIYEMMKIEPENPRWLGFSTFEDLSQYYTEGEFEQLISKQLFEGESSLLSEVIIFQKHKYLLILIERYASFLIAINQVEKALRLLLEGRKIFPQNSYLLFFKVVAELEIIRQKARKSLKENLALYLSLDKERSYDESHQDTQLLETGIAELNKLSGNKKVADIIMSQITDERSLYFWENWNDIRDER